MTAEGIIDRAFARSRRWVPEGAIPTATPEELVPAVYDSLYALFQIAARVNPAFYGADELVQYTAPGWQRPDDAEAIDWIERSDGEEVFVVSSEPGQRKAEPGLPCVYRRGGIYRPAGVTPGPNPGEPLIFFYSRIPVALAAPTDPIDPAFPVAHCSLLELDVGIRLALKDGGPSAEMVAPLRDERRGALARYVAFLEHEAPDERQSYGPPRGAPAHTLVSLEALLAGGVG